MQRNQINLGNMFVEKNKEFLKALYGTEDLERARKWFNALDCSVSFARQNDPDMNLGRFLDLITDSFHIVLQTGSPSPDEIRYCASGSDDQRVDRFAWVECPYNEHNYGVVSLLFEKVYNQKIDSIPVPESLRQYHKQFE
tara:strand:+ start:7638 stop:8057 length:420 start_codon:yes stop_codon:yes gene_type:complete